MRVATCRLAPVAQATTGEHKEIVLLNKNIYPYSNVPPFMGVMPILGPPLELRHP